MLCEDVFKTIYKPWEEWMTRDQEFEKFYKPWEEWMTRDQEFEKFYTEACVMKKALGAPEVPKDFMRIIWEASWKRCCSVNFWEPIKSFTTLSVPSIQERLNQLEMLKQQQQEYINSIQSDFSDLVVVLETFQASLKQQQQEYINSIQSDFSDLVVVLETFQASLNHLARGREAKSRGKTPPIMGGRYG